jgi:alkanesulfonate monooxygenase SsuD/methylene tetrahydromethanopterin reductase-like flavin-dependent oxidoreductase (luciferase family)
LKIGIALPITQTDEGKFHRYRELRAMAVNAEQAGFDSVWIFDHLLYRYPDKPARGVWEAWTILTALAEATDRVELGTLVLCTAFRNPAVLAKMADALEEISDGRLILGLGAGWNQPEFDAFGIPFDHLASRFEDAISIIGPLMREGAVDYSGTFYQAPDCLSLPRGPRPGGPPILIAGSKPRMLRLIAQHADAWNTAWIGTPALLPERVATLEAACVEVGRDPKSIDITVGITVAYPDLNPDLPERLTNPDYALFGSPQEIATGLRMHEEAGVAHVICVTNPFTAPALDRLAEAYRVYQQG